MYLTAHRVVSPTGNEGIHAFYRTHGESWRGLDTDVETAPSQLVRARRELEPGGNRVRSYLDIIAPDLISPSSIITDFETWIRGEAPVQFPCQFHAMNSVVRMGVERALAASWRGEAQRLFYECLHVWMSPPITSRSEHDPQQSPAQD